VEDDVACRLLLQSFLARYGECHVALNGREAVEAFHAAFARGSGYDLICMDIMMPEMDGREAVRQIRASEEDRGIRSPYGATIFMTTTMQEIGEVFRCFRELCDAYLLKPIDLGQLLNKMKFFQMVQ
jgi:two-component system chemotaxis response regulator CheY